METGQLQEKFESKRDVLAERLERTKHPDASNAPDEPHGDFCDESQSSQNLEGVYITKHVLQDYLAKVENSMHLAENGKYGLCQKCGKPIDPDRLNALVHVTLCYQCKAKEEAHKPPIHHHHSRSGPVPSFTCA